MSEDNKRFFRYLGVMLAIFTGAVILGLIPPQLRAFIVVPVVVIFGFAMCWHMSRLH